VVFPTHLFLETFDNIFHCEISSLAIDVCVQSLSVGIYELIYELSSFDTDAMRLDCKDESCRNVMELLAFKPPIDSNVILKDYC
jgi:hypothetical protein